ncbi:MAG: tRNA guanosine(34) transglycosylase Tgt [Patescibacteria group bacterium]
MRSRGVEETERYGDCTFGPGPRVTSDEKPAAAPSFGFTLQKRGGRGHAGRLGVLHTARGDVPTPVFMPVGTQATVKAMPPEAVREIGFRLILGNAYHLYLRPGTGIIAAAGGLHRFMAWPGAILTDSGGFQVFSLGALRRVSEEGVAFRSHIDGSTHLFTPEKVMEIERALGADIIMAFDECVGYPAEKKAVEEAAARSGRWAARSAAAWRALGAEQALFGIVQGGVYPDLRARSAAELAALALPGYGLGGLSVGEPKELMYETLEATVPLLPEDKPRYLMGVGTPDCLWEGVERGIDMFDCVFPTRVARNGTALTSRGRIIVRDARYAGDLSPLDPACACPTCRTYSRAYLRHLFKAGEALALYLLTYHNLYFLHGLMHAIRDAIAADRFPEAKREFLDRYGGDGRAEGDGGA